MKNCNIIPAVRTDGSVSQVVTSVMGLSDIISNEDIANMDIGLKSLLDLGNYIYVYSVDSQLHTLGLPTYDGSREVKLRYVVDRILANELEMTDGAKKVFNRIKEFFDQDVDITYNPNIPTTADFTLSEIRYSNLVLGQIYNEILNDRLSVSNVSQISLKKEMLKRLLSKINHYGKVKDFRQVKVTKYVEDILRVDSPIWDSFLTYINKTYGVNYKNVPRDFTIADIEGTFDDNGLEVIWDDIDQNRVNRKNTAPYIVKAKIASLLNDINGGESNSNMLYIPTPVDINTIWAKLLQTHMFDITEEDMIKSIKRIIGQFSANNKSNKSNIQGFTKILNIFEDAQAGDIEARNFVNSYVSTLKMAIIPVNHIMFDSKFVAQIITANHKSFPQEVHFDRFMATLSTNYEQGIYDQDAFIELSNNKIEIITKKDVLQENATIDLFVKTANSIGLDISRAAFSSYIVGQKNKKENATELANIFNWIIQDIVRLKSNKAKSYKSNQDNTANLYKLAGIASYDFDSFVNMSYLGVTGELEYSPQYDNLLTSLFRGIQVRGVVREEYLNYRFKDYLNDPTLENDNFLWYDSETGMGMFDRSKPLPNGGYKLNDEFLDRIGKKKSLILSQFSGTSTEKGGAKKGTKYRELISNRYEFTEIVANLMGQFIFLTSDSSRSYMIGVDHISTDDLFIIVKGQSQSDIEVEQNEGGVNYYKGDINPEENTIMVFGSNTVGNHGQGSALDAKKRFGAIQGQARGLQGSSYALVTKDLSKGLRSIPRDEIINNIRELYKVTEANPNLKFKIAYRNIGDEVTRNGYSADEMIEMFISAGVIPSNVYVSEEWYNSEAFEDYNIDTFNPVSRQGYIAHSGGAKGADAEFGDLLTAKGGIINHYYVEGNETPHGNVSITKEEAKVADEHLKKANKTLLRKFPTSDEYVNNLLRRNYYQVINSEAIYAVGVINEDVVNGGTGWAVQMAIDMGKPVYVFDQNMDSWYTYKDGSFMAIAGVPKLTKNFAAIGTRQLNLSGRIAIRELINGEFRPARNTIVNTNAKMFKAISKIVANDLHIFRKYGKEVFNIDENTVDGRKRLMGIHNVKYWNGRSILDENGVPTGRAFHFLNLSYKSGVDKVTFAEHIAGIYDIDVEQFYRDLVESVKNDTELPYDIDGHISSFVTAYIKNVEHSATVDFKDIAKSVMKTAQKRGDTTNSLIEGEIIKEINKVFDMLMVEEAKTSKTIALSREEVLYTKATEEVLNRVKSVDLSIYRKAITKLILNNTIYSTVFDNLAYGKISEFPNMTGFNKRSSGIIKTGLPSVDSNTKVNVLIVENMKFPSPIVDEMFEDSTDPEALEIKESYRNGITINDAQSIMTDKGLEILLKGTGRWDEYKSIFKDLNDDSKPFDPRKYNKLIEQLKLFSISRKRRGDFAHANTAKYDEQGNVIEDIFADEVDTVYIKDSTVVLFKSMTRNSAMGELYDDMVANEIHQISPVSAVKVSGITPYKLHNDNAQYVKLDSYADSMMSLQSSDFVVQLDVKADILDARVSLPYKFLKNIVQGLGAESYKIDGVEYKPKEVIKLVNNIIASITEEDSIKLLYDLGGIDEDGNIVIAPDGNLNVNTRTLAKFLRDSLQDDDSNSNILRALESDIVGDTTLPLSHPIFMRKFERLLTSKFTKNVVGKKLSGFHAPIRADIFTGPNKLITKSQYNNKEEYDAIIDDLVNNGSISYANSFIQRCKDEQRSLELKAERKYVDGQLVYYAEVIANPWMLEFFDNIPIRKTVDLGDGKTKDIITVDINAISEEARRMIGIRMPNEAFSSMVLFEVVGFLNTGATQAIFPQTLVARTGWDFDIDTIYAFAKHLELVNGQYVPIKSNIKSLKLSNEDIAKKYAIDNNRKTILRDVKTTKSDAFDGLNDNGFKLTTKYLVKLYSNNNEAGFRMDDIVPTINEILTNIKDSEKQDSKEFKTLRSIKSSIQDVIPAIVKRIELNMTNVYNTSREYAEAVEYLKSIYGRELSQEERVALNPGRQKDIIDNKRELFKDLLLECERDIIKLQKVIKSIDKNLNSISASEDSLITLEDYEFIKDILKPFITGVVDSGSINEDGSKRVIKIWDQFNMIQDNIQKRFKERIGDDTVNTKDLEQSISDNRKAKENAFIDIVFGILSNQYHEKDLNRQNIVNNIKSASQKYNAMYGETMDNLDHHNLKDKIRLNNSNMASTILKGHSINMDGFMAVLSTLQARSHEPIKYTIHKDHFPNKVTKKQLDELYGKGNWERHGEFIEIDDYWFNNNASGTFSDIFGLKISAQKQELTSAILDVLTSEVIFNLNTTTLGVYTLLSSTATTHLLNSKPNRYAYATAFISQPVIIDLVNYYNTRLIENPSYKIGNAIQDLIDVISNGIPTEHLEIMLSPDYKPRLYPIEKLDEFIENRDVKNELEEPYVDSETHLEILLQFRELNNMFEKMLALSFSLKSDSKVGSFHNTDRRNTAIADYYLDFRDFSKLFKDAYERGVDKINGLKESEKKRNLIKLDYDNLTTDAFIKKYPQFKKVGVVTKRDYFYEVTNFHKQLSINERKDLVAKYDLTFHKKPLFTVNGIDIIDSVFPELTQETIKDGMMKPYYGKSSYGMLQAGYQYGHDLPSKLFGKVFAQRSTPVKRLTRSFLVANNNQNNETYQRIVENKILEYVTQFAIGSPAPFVQILPKSVKQNILGIIPPTNRLRHAQYYSELHNNLGDTITDEKLSKFCYLTTEEQVKLIKTDKNLSAYINQFDFKHANLFNFIEVQENAVNEYGYSKLRIIIDDQASVSGDDVISSVLTMLQSPIPYIAHTIRNLIAYTYLTEGFTTGFNVAKYLPNEFYLNEYSNKTYNESIMRVGAIDPLYELHDWNERFKYSTSELINDTDYGLEESLDYIARQNPDLNVSIIKEHNIEKAHSNPDTASMGVLKGLGTVNYGEIPLTDSNGKSVSVILETVERVVNSRYANAEYITVRNSKGFLVYKRSEPYKYNTTDISKMMYYYYPVSRLLPNEFTEHSIIEDYNISQTIQNPERAINEFADPVIDVSTYVKSDAVSGKFLTTLKSIKDSTRKSLQSDYIGVSETINMYEDTYSDDYYDNDSSVGTEYDPSVDDIESSNYKLNSFSDVSIRISDKSLIDVIKEEYDKNDNHIYIGNDVNMNRNIYLKNGNFITVDFTENPHTEAERITPLLKGGNYLITGDLFKDANISKETAESWTGKFLDRIYELNGNIESINTIVNEGFGLSVSQIYVDTKRSNVGFDELSRTNNNAINIEIPKDVGVEARVQANSKVGMDAYTRLNNLIRHIRRNQLPRLDDIQSIYNSFDTSIHSNLMGEDLVSASEYSFDSIEFLMSHISEIVIEIEKIISSLLFTIESVNMDTIIKDAAKWQEHTKNIQQVVKLIKYLDIYKNVQQIDISDTTYDPTSPEDVTAFEEEFGDLNDSISTIQRVYDNAGRTRIRIKDKALNYVAHLVASQSRNPLYATAFSKILDIVRNDIRGEFDPNTIHASELKISNEEYKDIITKIYSLHNRDVTIWAMYLDSPFVTGITLTDIVGKQYTNTRYESNRKVKTINREIERRLDIVGKAANLDLSNDSILEDWFKKFVDESGNLIDTYDYSYVYSMIDGLKRSIANLHKNYYGGNVYTHDKIINLIEQTDISIAEFNRSHKDTFGLIEVSDEDRLNLEEQFIDKSEDDFRAYLRDNDYVTITRISKVGEKPKRSIYKIEFYKSATNSRLDALAPYEREFLDYLKKTIQGVIQEYNPNYVPQDNKAANMLPFIEKPKKGINVKELFELPAIKEDDSYEDISGRTKYRLHAHTLSVPEYNYLYRPRDRRAGEEYADYEAAMVADFKKWKQKTSKALDIEVVDGGRVLDIDTSGMYYINLYNREVEKRNIQEGLEKRSYNIRNIMEVFTKELYNIKSIEDFSVAYELGEFLLDESSKDNNADLANLKKMYKMMERNVYGVSDVKNSLDVGAKVLMRYASINYMWFNYTAGLKNILKGVSDMIIDSGSMSFATANDMRKGLGKIISITPEWVATHQGENSDNPFIALIKDFNVIFQDTKDTYAEISGEGWLHGMLSMVNKVGYSPNQIGEFFMQFGMLIACSYSHRVVKVNLEKGSVAKIMSFADFYNDTNKYALREILTDEQKKAFNEFIKAKDEEIEKYEKRKNKKYLWTGDYAKAFIEANMSSFTKEQTRKFKDIMKDDRDAYKKRFEQFPTFESILKVENGVLKFDESSGLNDMSVNEFKERVKAINQSLHGIYTKIDRNFLQERALGNLTMQFRKWVKPNYNRYFGRHFNKPTWNESLGTWEIPIYTPVFDILTHGYRMYKQNKEIDNSGNFFTGMIQMFRYQLELLKRAQFYYHSLSKGEQASLIKWAKHMATVATVAGMVFALGSLKDEDDDDENWTYTTAVYTLSALYKEVVEPIPVYGWYSTVSSITDKVVVGQSILQNAARVVGFLAQDFFIKEPIVYDRGIYKDQHKAAVAFKKAVPLWNQIQKQQHLKAYMNYYNQYNPFAF